MKTRGVIQNIVILLLVVFSTGCTSYRFAGKHAPVRVQPLQNTKFKLRSYQFSPVRGNPWSIAKFAGSAVKKADVERALLNNYPALFTTSSDGIPMDVRVTIRDSKGNHWGWLLYAVSIGCLPGSMGYKETCDVRVDVANIDDSNAYPEIIGLKSRMWMTCYGPIGLFMPKKTDEYIGIERTGAGMFKVPHSNQECKRDQQDVFSAEVAAGIALALSHRDSNDLKRLGVLYSLSEEYADR